MTLEEVALRLGIDAREVPGELAKFNAAVGHAGEKAHKSFIHAGTGARQFHKIVHELIASSPLLGAAFAYSLGPTVMLFMTLMTISEKVKEHITELNKELDEMRDKNAQAFGNRAESHNQALRTALEIEEEIKKLEMEGDRGQNPVIAKFEKEKLAIELRYKREEELRNDNAEKEKRKLEETFDLEKSKLEYAHRHKMMSQDQYQAMSFQLEKTHREAIQNLDDKKVTADRIASEKQARENLDRAKREQKELQEAKEKAKEEMESAGKVAGDTTLGTRKNEAEKRAEELRKLKEEVNKKLPSLQESAVNEDVMGEDKSGWGFGVFKHIFTKEFWQKSSKSNDEFEKAKNELHSYTVELEKTEKAIRNMEKAQGDHKRELEEAKKKYSEITDKLKEVTNTINSSPYNNLSQKPESNIDPRTGGIKLRSLQYKGIEYKPLPGTADYNAQQAAANMNKPSEQKDYLAELNKNMESMLTLARSNGLLVKSAQE